MTKLRFDGRVAIVTGAGGGLGLSHARLLAERGAIVVVNDLGGSVDGSGGDAGAATRAVAQIESSGGVAVPDTNSVSTLEGARALVQAAVDAFGRVDIVVNNAGILRDRSLAKMGADDFDAVIEVHLRGSFLVASAALPHMREQAYGRIVNTTSPAGLYGNFGQANYSSAKAGLVGLTKTIAREGSKLGIRANAVSPGAYTRMTEDLVGNFLGESAATKLDPAKVSPVVAWLCHEDCSVNGEVFGAVGGLVTRIFIAETRGILEENLQIESVSHRIDEIMNSEDFSIPRRVADSMAPILVHDAGK